MEHERADHDERDRAVARGQNVLYVLPNEATSIARFLIPALERLEREGAETQALVLTPDADTAVAVGETATRTPDGASVRALPVTSARRASRLLRGRPAALVAGTPADILELIRGAVLKLDRVRALVIAWADELVEGGTNEALESVMAEVPKDTARIVVASQVTPAVDALVERYARRPRRVGEVPAAEDEGVDLRYVAVAPQSRITVLRRLLDELDPEVAAVYARSDEAALELAGARRALGFGEGERDLVLTRGEAVGDASLVVLYEFPDSRETLRALAAGGGTTVALVTPRQLPALRALAGAGRVAPLTLSGPGARARSRQERLRAELRGVLAEGAPAHELTALEPLLAEYDGAEIAAAALRLLERERERARDAAAAEPERPSAARSAPVRIFINAGTRDNVGPRDIVGAISNEAKISSDKIGRVDVRENHTLVEVAADQVDRVVSALTGTVLRGRRVIARLDQDRAAPERGPRPRERGEHGERREHGERGEGREGGERRGKREPGERPRREERGRARGADLRARPRRPRDE